ncbi:hypothetical protein D3C87_2047050 [compost metagenome]
MPNFFSTLKDKIVKIYDVIQELNDIPMRNFSGEFYEEKVREKKVRRETKTKVEDLRPPKATE